MRCAWMILLLALPVAGGCAMCCSDDDYTYSAYGGVTPRTNMSHGRMGSAFGGELFAEELSVAPIETTLPAPYETIESPLE
jgi:hypothetical protein